MKEKIQKVKTEKKMPYPVARKCMGKISPWLMAGAKPLCPSVVAKKVDSHAVQTDIT